MTASGADESRHRGAGAPRPEASPSDDPQVGAGEGPERTGDDPDGPDELDEPIRRTSNRKAAAMIAAGMLAIDEILGRKPREEVPIVVDANGQPVDIDTDGIEVHVPTGDGGEVAVAAPALPRSRPVEPTRVGGRRRGRRA